MAVIRHEGGREVQGCSTPGCGFPVAHTIVHRDGSVTQDVCSNCFTRLVETSKVKMLEEERSRLQGDYDRLLVDHNDLHEQLKKTIAINGDLRDQERRLTEFALKLVETQNAAIAPNALPGIESALVALGAKIEEKRGEAQRWEKAKWAEVEARRTFENEHGDEERMQMLRVTVFNNDLHKYGTFELNPHHTKTATLAQGCLHGMLNRLIALETELQQVQAGYDSLLVTANNVQEKNNWQTEKLQEFVRLCDAATPDEALGDLKKSIEQGGGWARGPALTYKEAMDHLLKFIEQEMGLVSDRATYTERLRWVESLIADLRKTIATQATVIETAKAWTPAKINGVHTELVPLSEYIKLDKLFADQSLKRVYADRAHDDLVKALEETAGVKAPGNALSEAATYLRKYYKGEREKQKQVEELQQKLINLHHMFEKKGFWIGSLDARTIESKLDVALSLGKLVADMFDTWVDEEELKNISLRLQKLEARRDQVERTANWLVEQGFKWSEDWSVDANVREIINGFRQDTGECIRALEAEVMHIKETMVGESVYIETRDRLNEDIRKLTHRAEEAEQRLRDFSVLRKDYPDIARALQDYELLLEGLKGLSDRHLNGAPGEAVLIWPSKLNLPHRYRPE